MNFVNVTLVSDDDENVILRGRYKYFQILFL